MVSYRYVVTPTVASRTASFKTGFDTLETRSVAAWLFDVRFLTSAGSQMIPVTESLFEPATALEQPLGRSQPFVPFQTESSDHLQDMSAQSAYSASLPLLLSRVAVANRDQKLTLMTWHYVPCRHSFARLQMSTYDFFPPLNSTKIQRFL